MSTESALSYASLILADAELEISAENLLKLTSGASIEIDNIWAQIYAKALAGQDLQSLFVNFSAGPATAAAAPGAAGAAAAEEEAAEEEEEAVEEEDDDMGFGLFD